MKPQDGLIQENLAALQQAVDLIEQITDDQYTSNDHPIFSSGVGKHVRHILDFYAAFLGAENERVNYDARQRSPDVETSRKAAVAKIRETMDALERVAPRTQSSSVRMTTAGKEIPPSNTAPHRSGASCSFWPVIPFTTMPSWQ